MLIRSAWDDIQDARRLFIAKDNDGLVLCRCHACAVKENHFQCISAQISSTSILARITCNPKECPVEDDGLRGTFRRS